MNSLSLPRSSQGSKEEPPSKVRGVVQESAISKETAARMIKLELILARDVAMLMSAAIHTWMSDKECPLVMEMQRAHRDYIAAQQEEKKKIQTLTAEEKEQFVTLLPAMHLFQWNSIVVFMGNTFSADQEYTKLHEEYVRALDTMIPEELGMEITVCRTAVAHHNKKGKIKLLFATVHSTATGNYYRKALCPALKKWNARLLQGTAPRGGLERSLGSNATIGGGSY